jgi:hypothetical protein
MAIDQGTETINVKTVDSGWRVELFTDTAMTQLRFHRQIVSTDATTGEVIGDPDKDVPVVARTAAEVAGKTYQTSGGFSATGNQIINLVNAMSDAERQVDIDAQMSSQASPEQQPAFLYAKEPIASLPPPKPPKGKKK